MLTARNGIDMARYNLKLAQVTPVPDVDVNMGVYTDYSLAPHQTIPTLALGVPIPIWDHNKGAIMAAESALVRAEEEPHRVEQNLTNTLAAAYMNYKNNLDALEYYRRYILPDQVRAYRGAYDRRQIDPNAWFGDVVSSQQTLYSNVMTYLSTLGQMWISVTSVADEPLGAAAAGSGIFERSISNNFWGIGPHATLELKRRQNPWGLGWVDRLDGALLFGQVRQSFAEISTTPGPGGSLLGGETDVSMWEQVPMLSGFLGLQWRPPCRPNLDILLGYTGEYWWNVGRISDPDFYNGQSAGQVGAHGAQLRLQYNY